MDDILIVIGIAAALSLVFALLILLVSKFCTVKEDEHVGQVLECLAGANCGGCGQPGCEGFAKALVEGKAQVTQCGPTSNENKAKIAEILGVEFVGADPSYAVVKCAGGELAINKYEFVGNEGCISQNAYVNGKKVCENGCIGEGTCEKVCPYHAIKIENGVSLVDKALCESCGLCITRCPKKIIEKIPKSARVYVACSSTCRGKEVMNMCKSGCIGCGLCAKNCPVGAITMTDNLPHIDYSKCTGCLTCLEKCPRKTIREL